MSNTVGKIRSFLKEVIIIFFLVALIRTIIFEMFFVPSGSMLPTILEHELLFTTKHNYGYSQYSFWPVPLPLFKGRILEKQPERGDIVIFRPPNNLGTRYIKRIIGLPGEEVQLISGRLYINNKIVERENDGYYYSDKGQKYRKYIEKLPNGKSYNTLQIAADVNYLPIVPRTTPIYKVPEGCIFVMGDNRDESGDSRVNIGYIPQENIIAKARFIVASNKEEFFLSDLNFFEYFSTHVKHFFKWLMSFRINRSFYVF